MLLSIALLVHLLQSIMEDGRKEMSIYYMFGENMYTLKGCYVQHILALVRRHTVAGCLMATLVVSVFVLMIYMKLSAAVTILLSLFLPLLVLTLITHQLVKRTCIVEELFCDEKNGNI